jgi:site-specific recombinase XerD
MSKTKLSIEKLIYQVSANLEELNYQRGTARQYLRVWRELKNYVGAESNKIYSEEIGVAFLREKYGEIPSNKQSNYSRIQHAYRAIRLLGDYQMHRVILRSKSPMKKQWLERFESTLKEFKEYAVERDLTASTIFRIEQVLEKLFEYLYHRKIESCRELTREDIEGFVKTLSGYAIKTLAVSMYSLKTFLKYLCEEKITAEDLRKYIPKLRYVRRRSIPSTWTEAETKQILESIDRGNACGKRDYAILLLITRLGLRKSDVINLKFGNIEWEKNIISFNQQKTKESLTLPLLEDVGSAIISYLKDGRPTSDLPFIFLKQTYPFGQMTDVYMILDKYLRFSGVGKNPERQNGPHTLRHSLAGRLLEKDTPLEMIAAILGHSNVNVTNEYLKIDLKSLAECALDPEEVLCNVAR